MCSRVLRAALARLSAGLARLPFLLPAAAAGVTVWLLLREKTAVVPWHAALLILMARFIHVAWDNYRRFSQRHERGAAPTASLGKLALEVGVQGARSMAALVTTTLRCALAVPFALILLSFLSTRGTMDAIPLPPQNSGFEFPRYDSSRQSIVCDMEPSQLVELDGSIYAVYPVLEREPDTGGLGRGLSGELRLNKPRDRIKHVLLVCYAIASPLLRAEDVLDWPGLCARLSSDAGRGGPSPGRRIWELLPAKLHRVVEAASRGDRLLEADKRRVIAALNDLLTLRCFLRGEDFSTLALPEQATHMLRGDTPTPPSDKQIQGLNRLVLEAYCPRHIAKSSFRATSERKLYKKWQAEVSLDLPQGAELLRAPALLRGGDRLAVQWRAKCGGEVSTGTALLSLAPPRPGAHSPVVRTVPIEERDALLNRIHWRVQSFMHRPCLLGTTQLGWDVLSEIMAATDFYFPSVFICLCFLAIGSVYLLVLIDPIAEPFRVAARGIEFVLNTIAAVPRYVWLFIVILAMDVDANYNWKLLAAIAVTLLPDIYHEVKNATLRYCRTFREADRSIGMGSLHMILHHAIGRECRLVYFSQAVYLAASMILVETSLSCLGKYPSSSLELSWGRMIYNALNRFENASLGRASIGNPLAVWGPVVAVVGSIYMLCYAAETLREQIRAIRNV